MTDPINFFKRQKPDLYKRFQEVAKKRQSDVQLIMENVANPSNLGAIARSCDGFGIQQIGYSPTKRHIKAQKLMLKSSVSASQWIDYTEFTSTSDYFDQLHSAGWHIIGSSSEVPGTPLYEMDFSAHSRIAIAVGNEGSGLSTEALEKVDSVVTIPMYGIIRSFNVSVATAVILSEVSKQRQQLRFLLGEKAQSQLVERFISRYFSKRNEGLYA